MNTGGTAVLEIPAQGSRLPLCLELWSRHSRVYLQSCIIRGAPSPRRPITTNTACDHGRSKHQEAFIRIQRCGRRIRVPYPQDGFELSVVGVPGRSLQTREGRLAPCRSSAKNPSRCKRTGFISDGQCVLGAQESGLAGRGSSWEGVGRAGPGYFRWGVGAQGARETERIYFG